MTARAEPRPVRLAAAAPSAEEVLAALPDAVLVVAPDGTVREANAAAEAFLGLGRGHLVGQPLAAIVGPDSPLVDLLDRCREDGAPRTAYAMAVGPRRRAPHEADAQVAPLARGGAVVTLRPPSLARRLGEWMPPGARGRSLSGLAAVLAHEVRNPLSGIRGAAQLLERDVSDPDRALARLIVGEVDRIRALLDRMDDLSEGRPIALVPVNIHEVLEHVRRLAATGFAADLRLLDRYDPSLPPVLGDRDLLVQAFLNLVTNAAHAARQGQGSVTLRTAYQPGLRLAAPAGGARHGLPIVASVIDDGPGVPEAIRDHLFEPFVTGREGGRGLGLAVVARIVADLGGAIEVESRPGRTQFSVHLPVAAP
jgi:two-component system nitrogen regulation sensor histidine kinase GlnL